MKCVCRLYGNCAIVFAPQDQRRGLDVGNVIPDALVSNLGAGDRRITCPVHPNEVPISVDHLVSDDVLVDDRAVEAINYKRSRSDVEKQTVRDGYAHQPVRQRHRLGLLRRKSAGIDENEVRHAFGMFDGEKNGCAAPHGVTTNREPVQSEYARDLVDERHHAFLGIVAVGHGSGEPMPRQVYGDDAESITELFRPRLPGIERGIGAVNENERKRVARATIPDVGTRSVRQRQELRWRASVLRFEDCARDIGLADIPKRGRQEEKKPATDEEPYHGAGSYRFSPRIVSGPTPACWHFEVGLRRPSGRSTRTYMSRGTDNSAQARLLQ